MTASSAWPRLPKLDVSILKPRCAHLGFLLVVRGWRLRLRRLIATAPSPSMYRRRRQRRRFRSVGLTFTSGSGTTSH